MERRGGHGAGGRGEPAVRGPAPRRGGFVRGELTSWDLVERTPGGVRLGMRLFELGSQVPRQRGLREAAAPFMADLFEATHETIHLAILDGVEVVYVQKLESRGGPKVPSR